MEVATLITYIQLFGIGFSFGIAGPCLFFCSPILATYVAASQDKPLQALNRIAYFLLGRIFAYIILGYAAGLSGEFFRQIINSRYISYFQSIGGVVSIALGIALLLRRERKDCACKERPIKARSAAGFILFGILIGCVPCAPLVALLIEIALISKNAFDGAVYAFAFGAGTFLAGLIVAGSIAGIVKFIPVKLLKFEKGRFLFRIICAALLILFGLTLIW